MKAVALYAAVTLAVVTIVGALFALRYDAPAEVRAIQVSGVIAVVLQVAAFSGARALRDRHAIGGWVLGAMLCLAAVVVLGFSAPAFGLPLEAALLSLAVFLFITELVEPLLIRV